MLVCKLGTFKEKFHYTQMDIILVLIFQFVRRFPWPLTIFFDVKIIYAVFKALIFVTLVIFQMMNKYYTSESRVVSVNAV